MEFQINDGVISSAAVANGLVYGVAQTRTSTPSIHTDGNLYALD
jgi:PQQ-like domain